MNTTVKCPTCGCCDIVAEDHQPPSGSFPFDSEIWYGTHRTGSSPCTTPAPGCLVLRVGHDTRTQQSFVDQRYRHWDGPIVDRDDHVLVERTKASPQPDHRNDATPSP